jgi:hypothetical protein
MKRAHHYHVVNTGPGCVLPDNISAYTSQADMLQALRQERDIQRDMLAPDERIRGNLKRDHGFWIETNIVGRNRYFVYAQPCNDEACELLTSDYY